MRRTCPGTPDRGTHFAQTAAPTTPTYHAKCCSRHWGRSAGYKRPRAELAANGHSLLAVVDRSWWPPTPPGTLTTVTESIPRRPDLQPIDERTGLVQRLDQYRYVVVAAISDLDERQASHRPLPATDLTVGGIVKHLAWTEDHWFQAKFLGVSLPEPWASAPLAADPDWPFRSAMRDSVPGLMGLYTAACVRSRAVAASIALNAPAAAVSFGIGPVSLRWILIHMIDETARHAGHLDVLRDALGR